jgi:hypothetical protein
MDKTEFTGTVKRHSLVPRMPIEAPFAHRPVPPLEHDGYVFGLEDMRRVAHEVEPLVEAAARATEDPLLGQQAWTAGELVMRQNAGYLTFSIRQDGVLVGICFARHVREGAVDAGMFVKPAHRRGLLAVRFAQFVQGVMRGMGAKWMVWACDEQSESRRLAEYLGHRLVSRRYIADLTGASA